MAELAGRCERYKRATNSVLTWLGSTIPPPVTTAAGILRAAEAVASQGLAVPRNVLFHLNAAICRRREVHHMYVSHASSESDQDRTHAHFIGVLEKARDILASSKPASEGHERAPVDRAHEMANRFAPLSFEDEPQPDTSVTGTEAKERGEARLRPGQAVRIHGLASKPELNGTLGLVKDFVEDRYRYQVVIGRQSYLLQAGNLACSSGTAAPREGGQAEEGEGEDLLGESMCFKAACFLLDLQDLLKEARQTWRAHKEGHISLLAATAVTNAAVTHSSRLASLLSLEYPTLSTLERIVTAAYLSRAVADVARILHVNFNDALALTSDLAFGDSHETHLCQVGDQQTVYAVKMMYTLFLPARSSGKGEREREREIDQVMIKTKRTIREAVGATVSEAQANEVLVIVIESVVQRFIRLKRRDPRGDAPQRLHDLSHPLFGSDGLLYTSEALLRLLATGVICAPKQWSSPKPGFFGPPWDERTALAESLFDLRDYLGGVLPALVYYAHNDLRGQSGKPMHFPHLRLDELMPVFLLMQGAIQTGRLPLALVFALQALLFSVLEVQGEARCARIGVTTRIALKKGLQQTQQHLASGLFDDNITPTNLELNKTWFEWMVRRAESHPVSLDQGEVAQIGRRQRDQALFQTPWVAGQQLLVASLGCGLGGGCRVLDSVGQGRLVLHLYNAMLRTGLLEPLPLLDCLIAALTAGPALWIAGRPQRDFLKAFLLSFGHSASQAGATADALHGLHSPPPAAAARTLRHVAVARGDWAVKYRPLAPIEPGDLSLAYRRAADRDFADVDFDGVDGMQAVFVAIQRSFASDELVGMNLAAVGAHFLELINTLIQQLGLDGAVDALVAEGLGGRADESAPHTRPASGRKKGKQGKKGLGGPGGVRESAENRVRFAKIWCLQLLLCECDEIVEGPGVAASDRLKRAAQVMRDSITQLSPSSIRLFQ